MNGLILLDDGLGRFGPMVDLRPSFALRSGMLTTAERIELSSGAKSVGAIVPEPLAAMTSVSRPDLAVNRVPDGDGPWLVVNGRLLSPPTGIGLEPGSAEIDPDDGAIRRAVLGREDLEALVAGESRTEAALPQTVRRVDRTEPPLAAAAWDVFTNAGVRIGPDLGLISQDGEDRWMRLHGGTVIGDHPIRIARTATLDPLVVIDARDGAVVVESDAHIGAHAVLTGPCAILQGTRVAAHATIKSDTIIGPGCRIGGEVGGTIFQGFGNKSHEGHLGDSWVGEWVNLGAATVNSNLLNTYGEVSMRLEPDGPRLRSGRQFLGCVIGDHVKTAIGTRIMTGTVLGTGAMIATSTPPPTTLERFAWTTDDGVRSYRIEKFLSTARSVLSRRDREVDPAMEARLRGLHAVTCGDDAS